MTTYFAGGGGYLNNGRVHHFVAVHQRGRSQPRLLPTHFLPHGLACDPVRPERMIWVEKKGPGAVALALKGATVHSTVFEALDNHHFYGHCAFVERGEKLLTVESSLISNEGKIVVRDASTLAVLDCFPSYGDKPHDLLLLPDNTTVVVSNAGAREKGSKGSVAYINVQTRELLDRKEVTSDAINAGHLAIDQAGRLVLTSAPADQLDESEPGGVSLAQYGSALKVLSEKAAYPPLTGETLSVAISEKNQLAITCTPRANALCVWSLVDGALMKYFKMDGPRGVVLLDEDTALVTYGPNSAAIEVDLAKLVLKAKTHQAPTYITGSHLFLLPEAMFAV